MEGGRWEVEGKKKKLHQRYLPNAWSRNTNTEAEKDMFGWECPFHQVFSLIKTRLHTHTRTPALISRTSRPSKISASRADSSLIVFQSCSANRPNPGECFTKSPGACALQKHPRTGNTILPKQLHNCSPTSKRFSGIVRLYGVCPPSQRRLRVSRWPHCLWCCWIFLFFKAVWCPVVHPSPLDHRRVQPADAWIHKRVTHPFFVHVDKCPKMGTLRKRDMHCV